MQEAKQARKQALSFIGIWIKELQEARDKLQAGKFTDMDALKIRRIGNEAREIAQDLKESAE